MDLSSLLGHLDLVDILILCGSSESFDSLSFLDVLALQMLLDNLIRFKFYAYVWSSESLDFNIF